MADTVPIGRSGLNEAMRKRGLERIDPGKLPDWMTQAIYHTAKTHTSIMVGNGQEGYTLKIICDSTGGIVQLPCSDTAKPKEGYPRCQYCGHIFGGASKVIEAEVMFDTDLTDAWPALPTLVDEYGA